MIFISTSSIKFFKINKDPLELYIYFLFCLDLFNLPPAFLHQWYTFIITGESGTGKDVDEIGELPLDIQVKLLRVIQDREVTRLGSNKPIKVDIRLITATNQNLEESVIEKKFREDLFYRLNVINIDLPPPL